MFIHAMIPNDATQNSQSPKEADGGAVMGTFSHAHLAKSLNRAEQFTEKIRETAERILGVRSAVRRDYGNGALFHFECLTIKQRKALVEDIVILYEALLFALGKMDMDFVYPENRKLTKGKTPKTAEKSATASARKRA
jgi:hypothetical protein